MNSFDTFLYEIGLGPSKAGLPPESEPPSARHRKATTSSVGTDLGTRRIGLIEASNAGIGYILNLTIYLGLQEELQIIDGSNRFDLHYVAYGFRRFTPDWERAAKRTKIVRAFTCYEMVKALEKIPNEPHPLLVIDLLSTFYDEAVTNAQSTVLVKKALKNLERIKEHSPVVLTLSPPPADQQGRSELVSMVKGAVDSVFIDLPIPSTQRQLSFFE